MLKSYPEFLISVEMLINICKAHKTHTIQH